MPYDFETLVHFDLSEIKGKIIKATLLVEFGDSTLKFPFNNVIANIVNQDWSEQNVTYDTFCDSFTICLPWEHPIGSFNNVENGQTFKLSNSELVETINKKRAAGDISIDFVVTSAPYERSYFANIESVSLFIEY